MLGILHQKGVLLDKEIFVLRDASIAGCVFRGAAAQVRQLVHHLLFARFRQSEACRVPVGLRVVAEVIEAGIAGAGPAGSLGVHLAEVAENRRHGGMKTVEIQPIETRFLPLRGGSIVEGAQPADKVQHVRISPHPQRKAPEVAQRLDAVGITARASHIPVDPIGVRPVGFDRDRRESLFSDQAFRDHGALAIEFMRAMRGFAQEHQPGIAHQLHQRIVIARRAFQSMTGFSDGLDCGYRTRQRHWRSFKFSLSRRARIPNSPQWCHGYAPT